MANNIVHCGWMTKSPPERKLRKQFKIFRSHWKKRYFVLRKPTGSLPDQYELHYYKDQRCQSKKGSIDLDQCQQIIEALDSDVFPYLLAIKTSYKHKVRTYYLATDSEEDMNTWVQWLCHVCGLRPEDQPTDIPDPKPDYTSTTIVSQTRSPGASHTITNGLPPNPQLHTRTSTCSSLTPLTSGQASRTKPLASDSSPNQKLSETSPLRMQPIGRDNSVESNYDCEPPPLPQKRHGGHINGVHTRNNDVPSLYDHPPTRGFMEVSGCWKSSNQYKSSSVSSSQSSKHFVDEVGRGSLAGILSSDSPHSSLSIHSDSHGHPEEGCDCPYNSDNEIPPERPPKPFNLTSPYQNLPQTGKISAVTDLMSGVPAPARSTQLLSVTGYDIPRQSAQRSPKVHHVELTHLPAAPTNSIHRTFSTHTYLNTGNYSGSFVDLQVGHDEGQNSCCAETATAQSVIPPSGVGIVGDHSSDHSASSVYHCPPSISTSRIPSGSPAQLHASNSKAPLVIPRAHNGSPASSPIPDESTSSIFSTKRTRSFKSPHSLKCNVIRKSPKAKALSLSATVPAPRPMLPPRPSDMITSENDEELQSHDQEEETHHPLSLLRSVPAPSETERELKYIDLAPPESCQEVARFSHQHGHHTHNHADRSKEVATEYRQIDFVKTEALSATKRVTEKERKNDDQL